MSQLAQYLITILSAALAISLIGTVLDNKSPVTATIKLICGIFMLLTAYLQRGRKLRIWESQHPITNKRLS